MHCDLPRTASCVSALRRVLFAGLGVFGALVTAEVGAQNHTVSSGPAEPAKMSGQKVYNEVCVACHSPPGVGGAPALGNREAWAPRLAQGRDTLIEHALNGFSSQTGIMPKKGGRLDLSDEEIISGLDYMLERVAPDH